MWLGFRLSAIAFKASYALQVVEEAGGVCTEQSAFGGSFLRIRSISSFAVISSLLNSS